MDSKGRDIPRSLEYEEVRAEREQLLKTEPQVQPLREFVEKIREEKPGRDVPDFDPLDGGIEAQCLFLFEAAGGKTIRGGRTNGSGFASRDNDDASAQKFFDLNNEEDFDRRRTISWNIVPWALRQGNRNYSPKAEDIEKGMEWLEKLLNELEDLEVVVLCGNSAHKATGFFYTKHKYRDLCVLHAPHPSPQSMNQPGKEEHLRAAIRKASQKLKC